jgi:hypothetical protein
MTNPQPLLIVGEEIDTGVIEMQDMLFTATGATAGVVLVEWNIAESSQGSAAMWGKETVLEATIKICSFVVQIVILESVVL